VILQLLGKTTPLTQGWNRLGEKYGAWVWGDNGLLVNVGGALHFDTITLNGATYAEPNVLPPRSGLVFRKTYPKRTPAAFKIGRKEVPYAKSLSSKLPDAGGYARLSRLWLVAGTQQADTPGAIGIEPLCGYSRDPVQIVNLADAMMARTALYWLNCATGEPIPSIPQPYADSRGWAKDTQIHDVCDPFSTDPYDDRRKPKQANPPNGCPYEDALTGLDRYNSWIAPDGQHIIRTLGPVLAAVACGDPVAAFYAKVLAADAGYATTVNVGVQDGCGSTYFGTRAVAWQTLAMLGTNRDRARQLLTGMLACQMPNGGFQNAPFGTTFSPDPWQDFGCPKTYNVEASMERAISTYVLAQAGQVDAVRKSLSGVFDSHVIANGYVPKFLVVAKNGVPVGQLTEGYGPPDYFPWLALGAYAALAPQDRVNWERWCLSIATPSQGRATSLKDLRDRLHKDELGRGLCVAMLSVLESMSL